MSQSIQPAALLRDLLTAESLPGRRVLLYGAADEALALWLAKAEAEVALLDPCREVALATLRLVHEAGAGRRVRAVHAPSTALPMFADFAFDVIVLQAGLPYELSELARILRPAARLISPSPLDAAALAHFSRPEPHPASSGLAALLRRPAPLFWSARRI